MVTHDIIDNRSEKLVDHLREMLASTESARFAVGYLFLSGLTSLAEKLTDDEACPRPSVREVGANR